MNLETDILIIGGGSAGSLAAIVAKEQNPNAKVLVIEKGEIHRSGSIAMGMDALNIVVQPGISTPEEYLNSARIATDGILDYKPSYVMAERSYSILKRLEGWGIHFPKDEQDKYISLQVHAKGKFLLEMDSPDLKLVLAEKIKEAGVQVLNRTMVTSLLETKGKVHGAMGFNLRTGEFAVVSAKATILANGGCARFSLPNSGYLYGLFDYPGNAGDGYSLAYRAGAQLTGFEYTSCSPLIKDINCPLLYITITRGAKVINAFGEEIELEYLNTQTMLKELREGRGPIFIQLNHLPEEQIQEIERILFTTERPIQKRFWENRGIDFREGLIELGITEYQLCGGHGLTGIVVNEKAETTLEGLYAAGDVACVPLQHLTGAFVFGQVAAENAVAYAKKTKFKEADKAIIESEKEKLFSIINDEKSSGKISVKEFEYKVRRTISDYVVPPKNERKLLQALWWIPRFRKEMKDIRVTDYHELSRFKEIQFILDCAELSVYASLERKESRWGWFHYRSDYPEQDDDNWLKHVVLEYGLKSGEPQTTLVPIKTKEN
ncbi:MAG: fumarate reductase/succinate dehydrogenase flavoprotein subunit [Candidatus Heimdallarchaeota archaeon]|nr:fumarate reductase/succinate dehydrogenase flavoprotein subunit [Candidatus Heimdallarchaeota archaeon]MCK4289416.1 fumarate reductase/succinate dehydrogenase flavoprotein subunit [Candidatus Heimdallarchaeota archaeon]